MNQYNSELANNIKRIRKANNLTQEEFADRLGRSKQSVSKWENGESVPTSKIIAKISQEFNVQVSKIVEGYVPENINSTNEDIKRIYDAINSLNMKVSILSSGLITEKYMNASKKKGHENLSFFEYENFPNPENQEDYEEYMIEQFEREQDISYALDITNHFDFNGAIDICNSRISKGEAEFAKIAIDVYEKYYAVAAMTYDEEEYESDMEEKRKYAKIYIYSLMKKYDLGLDDLLELD